jgi:hypothetical protein
MEFIPERWLDTEEKASHTAKLESVLPFQSRELSILKSLYSSSFFWGYGKRCELQLRRLVSL